MSITVCIPTFNQEGYIRRAIESVLQQSFPVSEILIGDDASTDGTSEILKQMELKDGRVRVLRNSANMGIAKNANQLLRQARGNYICRLDSDDILAPNYVARLKDLLDKYPDAAVAHANVEEIDERGRHRRFRLLRRQNEFETSKSALLEASKGYKVAANICMFRRSALEVVNFLDGRPEYTEDYDLYVRLAAAGFGNAHCSDVLAEYRVWVDSAGVRFYRKEVELKGLIRIFDESLNPAWKQNGFSAVTLSKARRRFALAHATYLSEVPLQPEEYKRIVGLLYQLGVGWRLRAKIVAIECGLGSIFRVQKKIKIGVRDVVKKIWR